MRYAPRMRKRAKYAVVAMASFVALYLRACNKLNGRERQGRKEMQKTRYVVSQYLAFLAVYFIVSLC